MSAYEMIAVLSVEKIHAGIDPVLAWQKSASEIFPAKKASREKSCPRSAFLGLAEEGLICGVSAGKYTNSVLNKQYAVDAVDMLQVNGELVDRPDEL